MQIIKLFICYLIFAPYSSFCQNAPTVLSIKKSTCCDSLLISISKDTVKYDKIISKKCFGVSINNCYENGRASIISFEISINNKKEFVKGNCYDFKKLTHLKSGGEIIISKCIINCKIDSQEPKTVILPYKRIIVVP